MAMDHWNYASDNIFFSIIHEKNTKKNDKRVVSLYVIEISLLTLTKLTLTVNFDFLDLHNVFFENYFAN